MIEIEIDADDVVQRLTQWSFANVEPDQLREGDQFRVWAPDRTAKFSGQVMVVARRAQPSMTGFMSVGIRD